MINYWFEFEIGYKHYYPEQQTKPVNNFKWPNVHDKSIAEPE